MARTVVTYDAGTWDVAGVAPTSSPITVTDAALSTSDITTNNASTSKHGFAPKYPNDATKYLDGTGAYTVPPGSGGGITADQLPWLIDVDVYATAIANTTWDTVNAAAGFIGGGDKRNGGLQNSVIAWDVALAAGTWSVLVMAAQDNNRGILTIKLDATTVGTLDFYNAAFAANVRQVLTGVAVAATGKTRLSFTTSTKNASSSGYWGTIQHVTLQRTA